MLDSRSPHRTALAVFCLLLAPAAGVAQRPAGATAPTALDAKARAEVIDSIAAYMERSYVSRDTARLIGRALRTRAGSGAYDAAASPARFAELVTTDMRSVNDDLHLSLRFAPGDAPNMRRPGPNGVDLEFGGPDGDETPPPPPTPEEVRRDPFLRNATRQNYGLTRVEILPGNVGYLEISGFMGAPGADVAIGHAMRFLAGTDAVIIDVRRNGGGSSEMSHMVFSHFLADSAIPTIRVVNPAAQRSVEQRSYRRIPGPRRPDVPLYVLTSRRTASAAEEFSFVLKNLGRAVIVGDRTAGAGHMVSAFNAGHGFIVSVSFTRVTDPRSGKEWERVGVQPELVVDREVALQAAHAAALRRVAERTDDARVKRSVLRIAEGAEASVRPVAVDAARLARFAGKYEGGREVTFRDGALLYYPRVGVLAERLIPLGNDSFALLGDARVLFTGEGGATRLVTETADGTRLSYARLSARDQP